MRSEPLTREQAQAVADILSLHADEYFDLVEAAMDRFPDVDWESLCLPDWADPRERIPPKPFIGPRLPDETARRMDRMIREHNEALRREMSKPAFLYTIFAKASNG